METVIAWIVSFIVATAPPDRPQFIKESKETKEEALARYDSIAKDVIDVVWADPQPPIFSGPNGRARTVAVILSIMSHESGFRKDVDLGLGKSAKGDGGHSWCLMQLNIGDGRTATWNTVKGREAYPADPESEVAQGWTGKELVTDRKKCITAGLRVIRMSFAGTAGFPLADRLRVYASGSSNAGGEASARRMNLATKWYASNPSSLTDDEVSVLLKPKAKDATAVVFAPGPFADTRGARHLADLFAGISIESL